jgi:hypothetical protein
MARLRNLRHEQFANEIVAGRSAAAAYLAAGLRRTGEAPGASDTGPTWSDVSMS